MGCSCPDVVFAQSKIFQDTHLMQKDKCKVNSKYESSFFICKRSACIDGKSFGLCLYIHAQTVTLKSLIGYPLESGNCCGWKWFTIAQNNKASRGEQPDKDITNITHKSGAARTLPKKLYLANWLCLDCYVSWPAARDTTPAHSQVQNQIPCKLSLKLKKVWL